MSSLEDAEIVFRGRPLPKTDEEVDRFNAEQLRELEARHFLPREVHLQVSKRCNLQCVMCSWQTWHSNVGNMDLALFERIIEECKEAGVRKIVFGNAQGEPFLHPKILEMLARAVAEGFWVMVSTNGTPLTPARIERLAHLGLNNIQFSFAGYNKDTYEKVYVGGKWEHVTRNLQLLAEKLAEADRKTTLVINGCYARELLDRVSPTAFIAKTRAYLNSIGIFEPPHQIIVQLPHNFGGTIETGAYQQDRLLSYYDISTRKPGLCRVLKNGPGIYHDGRVTACGCLDPNGDLLIGDIKSTNIASIRTGEAFQNILNTFMDGDLKNLPLCNECDIPYFDTPDESPGLWPNLVEPTPAPTAVTHAAEILEKRFQTHFTGVLDRAAKKMGLSCRTNSPLLETLHDEVLEPYAPPSELAATILSQLFKLPKGKQLIEAKAGRPIRTIGLAPATKFVLEHLDWFQERFDEVRVGDNFKAGQTHHGQEVLTVEDLLAGGDSLDAFLITTDTPKVTAHYREVLPSEQTVCITKLQHAIQAHWFADRGLPRAERIIAEIEASRNPLVVLGNKLLATAEPTFAALDNGDYDVFVISLFDKMENHGRTGWDQTSPIYRNALVTPHEQWHILTHLKKGMFWIYYDFFVNVGWDTDNAARTYARAAAMTAMAVQPVVLGMYDIIKPVCKNMDNQDEAFSLYKVMLDQADAVALTSKSDHIAEYLRNTLVKDRPILSHYRFSHPPKRPLERLSRKDGQRHLVGVTSFLGEVFEPNRIETRNSIRSILRQGIHFHYYSDNPKVFAFRDELTDEERAFFHIEPAIWDQHKLVHEMSRYDGGWLVGDEAAIFAKLICDVKDPMIRDLFSLFVPNGVPTSSMTYGAAGLPVFISRSIKVMDEVYPKGCCIPLNMAEVANLAHIFDRLDWDGMHETMQAERHRFDTYHHIPRLAAFLDAMPRHRVVGSTEPPDKPGSGY
ncbi:radical SAM protein [Sulfidibacter corallicola]|uniref:Radical SAM protein n=1 Tax=Sulfidibacter corallicola TaxID=2818388 RepID=A0A8A4TVE9_SULCO|nr:radical SAM protein [Sulfidibacter corallicola]QTD53490.1 radical SAM protein [Sulfidibacter corallicola]